MKTVRRYCHTYQSFIVDIQDIQVILTLSAVTNENSPDTLTGHTYQPLCCDQLKIVRTYGHTYQPFTVDIQDIQVILMLSAVTNENSPDTLTGHTYQPFLL